MVLNDLKKRVFFIYLYFNFIVSYPFLYRRFTLVSIDLLYMTKSTPGNPLPPTNFLDPFVLGGSTRRGCSYWWNFTPHAIYRPNTDPLAFIITDNSNTLPIVQNDAQILDFIPAICQNQEQPFPNECVFFGNNLK